MLSHCLENLAPMTPKMATMLPQTALSFQISSFCVCKNIHSHRYLKILSLIKFICLLFKTNQHTTLYDFNGIR